MTLQVWFCHHHSRAQLLASFGISQQLFRFTDSISFTAVLEYFLHFRQLKIYFSSNLNDCIPMQLITLSFRDCCYITERFDYGLGGYGFIDEIIL